MKNRTYLFACVVLCSGCVATLPTLKSTDSTAPDKSPVSVSPAYKTAPLSLAQLPADTGLAMAGIVHLIRGETPNVDNLTIAPGIKLTEPGVPLESFQFIDLTILDRAEKEVVKGQSWDTKTMAVLTFGLGPWRALMLTEAHTTTTATGVLLRRASVRPLSPAQPRTVAWFVPKAAFLAAIGSAKALPVWDLMDLANGMGVPIGAGQPPAKGPHLVVVFVLDRLEPGDTVKASKSDSPTPTLQWMATTQARDGVGFPVVMVDINDPLNVAAAERFVHVMWRPSDNSRTGGRSVDVPVGRFSTANAFTEPRVMRPPFAGTVPASASATAVPTARPGRASTGSARLLNTHVKNDALLIQDQLKKMGYYAGVVDGDFGKMSLVALSKFKTAKGLGTDASWSLAVQAALFGASGP